MKSVDTGGDYHLAKASTYTITDVEGRKRGEQTGLDTLVVHAVNDEYSALEIFSSALANALNTPPE